MKKRTDNQNKVLRESGKVQSGASPVISIIVALYAIVPVFTPNLETSDSNGPKFLALALLNFFTWGVIFFRKKSEPSSKDPINFVRHPVGMMISLLILLSLISCLRVINISEFLITLSKILTTCTAALILFIIFRMDRQYFRQLLWVLGIILLIDCLSVFYGTFLYIERRIEFINDVKSVYSNKNILASAIFVKVPVAIWLHLNSEKRWKFVGLFLLLCAFSAILLLSARAFYMGLILVTVIYLSTLFFRYYKEHDKSFIRLAIEYVSALSIAILLFSFVQAFLFPAPTKTDQYNRNIVDRIGSITAERGSSNRTFYWKNSFDLIKDHPLRGVGLGNWKIVDLKYENRTSQDRNYIYHAHNDFIETTAETGIFGGLAYLSVFIFTLFFLVKGITGKSAFRPHLFRYVSCLGLLCYGVDAFFNFPSDRAEMQSLLAIYLASVICFSSFTTSKIILDKKWLSAIFIGYLPVLLFALFCLWLNFISLRYQRITRDDIRRNYYTRTAAFMLRGFPFMPDISGYGEPLACFKSRYLTNEKKYDQAIRLLQNDKSSPYDPRTVEFISYNFHDWGKIDSSLKYAEKCIAMKPAYYHFTEMACEIYNTKGQFPRSLMLLQSYIRRTRSNPNAWKDLSIVYARLDDREKSISALDSGLFYCPGDTSLIKSKDEILQYFKERKYEKLFQEADSSYIRKEFKNAVIYCTRIIDQDTTLLKVYELRGMSLLYSKEYRQAISDFSMLIRHIPSKGQYYNNRGVCYYAINSLDDACRDFKKGMDLGDTTALSNYAKYCRKK